MISTRSESGTLRFVDAKIHATQRAGGVTILENALSFEQPDQRLYDYLAHWADNAPDRLFIAERVAPDDPFQGLTYRETYERVRLVAANLIVRGLGPDKPVAILSGNSIDHQILCLAAMMAGAPCAPISPAYSTLSTDFGKLRHILGLVDPGLVYAADGAAFARALSIDEMAGRQLICSVKADEAPNAELFDALLAPVDVDIVNARDASNNLDTVAKLLFTSGSTGVPKGVMTTHRMMVAAQEQIRILWPFFEDEPPVILDWLPWSHVFGGSFSIGTALRYGGTFFIDDGKPLPGEFSKTCRNLREIAPTFYWSVPKAYEFLAAQLRSDDALRASFFSRLKFMFYAGASLPAPLWAELEAISQLQTGDIVPMLTSWGLTETAPSITIVNRAGAGVGNVGVPMPGLQLKLVPNRGKLEARVRGPNVMPGYWRMQEATEAAFDSEGFFRTEDALQFLAANAPDRGLRFDGRVTEDFKLLTGTWVNVAEVRSAALTALAGLASNAVVTAPDRSELGLLVVAPPNRDPDDPTYAKQVAEALSIMNQTMTGASQRIMRALVLRVPPSLDTGEMTDKGSLNSRLILERRRLDVERLYEGTDADIILVGN
ncbi:MAG: AMP-binding protein [Methylobacteriaceae bacterium]|mgnify:CR=1 FL=1|nr:AMP-binding protein [Methylobacteriaceae bacterium]